MHLRRWIAAMVQTIGNVERLTECQHDLKRSRVRMASLSSESAHLGGHRLVLHDEDVAVVMKFSGTADRERRRGRW